MEQAETDRMKAGRSRRRETETSKKRRRGDMSREKDVVRSREDGQGVCSKRRVKVTAMRHNPVRKGQVTVDSTDSGSDESEDNSEAAKRRRAMKAYKDAKKEGKKLRGSGSPEKSSLVGENGNSDSERAVPRKRNINKAALKINRIESDSNESWKKNGSSQDDLSTDEN